MSTGGAEAFAAAFRNLGIDARVTPEGDETTYELAGKYMSGDECLPARVTAGNFLRVLQSAGSDTSSIAIFMPTASGPCRLGQYAPFMRHILDEMGHEEVEVVSPSSANGYADIGDLAGPIMKLGWLALVGSDALRKMLHIYRPMETEKGAADAAHAKSLKIYCREMERAGTSGTRAARLLSGALEEARDIFRDVPVDRSRELMLIGVVGEIFCRLSTFSNEDLIRQIEGFGGRAWLSDISEWVWYTDAEKIKNLRRDNKSFSMEMAGAVIKRYLQKKYEKILLAPLAGELSMMPEPHDIKEILGPGEPYLPWYGALGEMALSAGKSVYLYEKGVDGIIDISPFTCMNGIVTEAVYPRISRDHEDIPIRSFYFDGTRSEVGTDLAVFMELVRNYNRKKTKKGRTGKVA